MSSPIDYIFLKSLDNCVVLVNILSSSDISIEFVVRNTILDLRWFELSSTTPRVSFPTHVWSCLGYTLDSLLFLQLFLEYFLWSSTPTPTCNTMLMLPRSMTEVFRISTRTLEAHCRMFLDLLSKQRCMGNIMILPSPPLSKCFWTCCHIMYILLRFPLGKDTLPILVCKHIFLSNVLINLMITFSFPLFCLNFLVVYEI